MNEHHLIFGTIANVIVKPIYNFIRWYRLLLHYFMQKEEIKYHYSVENFNGENKLENTNKTKHFQLIEFQLICIVHYSLLCLLPMVGR